MATSWCVPSVCEEDLGNVLDFSRFIPDDLGNDGLDDFCVIEILSS